MANYICDVLMTHAATGAALETALTTVPGRTKMWGMEETYHRIGALDTGSTMRWFWPRINDNIALRGHWISSAGANNGIAVDINGNVGIGVAAPGVDFLGGTADLNGTYQHISSGAGNASLALVGGTYAALYLAGLCGASTIGFKVETEADSCVRMSFVNATNVKTKDFMFFEYTEGGVYINRSLRVGALAGDPGDGNIAAEGDIFTDTWQAFNSTVTGLEAAGLTKTVKYKKVGKLVFVSFYIAGTTTNPGGSIGFTLPYQGVEDISGHFPANLKDNITWESGCLLLGYLNSHTKAYVARSLYGAGSFSSAVAAEISGQFFYEAVS